MPGLAADGDLIYFEDQRTPPSPDMLGQVVVVELDTDEVLIKRLLRGSKAGRYDLESLDGITRRNAKDPLVCAHYGDYPAVPGPADYPL